MTFQNFNQLIQSQFERMAKNNLYVSNVSGDQVWETYLNGFLKKELFRVNQVNDGNYDKSFIRKYGNVVSIIDNKIVSIWDIEVPEDCEFHNPVMEVRKLITGISGVFIETYENLQKSPYEKCKKTQEVFQLGMSPTFAEYKENFTYERDNPHGKIPGKVYTFNHFHVYLPKSHVDFSGKSREAIVGELNTTRQLFEKTMSIPLDTLKLIRDLIIEDKLARTDGELPKVEEVIKLKQKFDALQLDKSTWLWANIPHISIARFSQCLLGTLCIELAEGKDFIKSIKDYNFRNDTTNKYKSVVIVTERQKKDAEQQLIDLGYVSEDLSRNAFERRFANIDDIDVSEIQHSNIDHTVEKPVGLFGKAGVPTNQFSRHKRAEFDKVETITIDKFMKDVLPNSTSVEVFLENRMEGNLVSLFTTKDKTAKNLFKWDNPFSWTYNGNLSGKSQLTQMVESKGGRVDGVFRFTHSWNEIEPNQSLMDLHVFMPGCQVPTSGGGPNVSGRRIGWNQRQDRSSKGVQDVDYTEPAPQNYVPVENITFPKITKMPDGVYTCKIHNWNFRTSGGRGRAEIAFDGQLFEYIYPATKHHDWITIAEVTLKNGKFSIIHHIEPTNGEIYSKKIWNLETNQFHKVNLVCESPNHWGDNKIGTKEYFFMLQDCKTDEPMRAFHIDQLNSELMNIRKSLDLLGNYKMVEPSEKQLSGVGFNCTTRDELVVKVKGTHQRVLKIQF